MVLILTWGEIMVMMKYISGQGSVVAGGYGGQLKVTLPHSVNDEFNSLWVALDKGSPKYLREDHPKEIGSF